MRLGVTFGRPNTSPGATFTKQAAMIDPGATFGISMSNALLAVTH